MSNDKEKDEKKKIKAYWDLDERVGENEELLREWVEQLPITDEEKQMMLVELGLEEEE